MSFFSGPNHNPRSRPSSSRPPSNVGQNRPPPDGGPNGVRRSYASELREHESLFTTYEHLQGMSRGDSALTLLRKVASMAKPMMRKRGWKVHVLAEFLPPEPNLLGLNINKGYKICLRLRYHNNPDLFLPLEQIADTLLHELSHNIFGDHDANFHRLWEELRDEYETLLIKGFTGEGFLGQGRKLGGFEHVPPPQEMRRLARASAEEQQIQAGVNHSGLGRRLGGKPIHRGQDAREVIAGQALLRTTINRGCGSIRRDISTLAEQTGRLTFKTEAERNDVDNRAIAEALFDLMEAEESAKLNGTFRTASTDGGLAWSKEHGLFDPSSHDPHDSGANNMTAPSEEEQMRWALEESKRLAPRGVADTGGLPPESLISPISPLSTATQTSAAAARLRNDSNYTISPVSPLSQNHFDRSQDRHQQRPSLSAVVAGPAMPAAERNKSIVSASGSLLFDISEPFNPDQWVCEICTCINPNQYLACDACGTERTAGMAQRSSSEEVERPPSIGREPPRVETLGWNCGNCGSFMEHRWWTCTACGEMKTSS